MKAIITYYDPLKGYARLRPRTFADETEPAESDDASEQEVEAIVEEVPAEPVDGLVDELTEEPDEQEEIIEEYFFHVSQVQSHTFLGITVGTHVTFEPLEPDSNLVRWVKIQD